MKPAAPARRPPGPAAGFLLAAALAVLLPARPGLAAITARMIGKGTKLLSADYLENMIESMGAEYSVTVLMDYTVLTIHVLEEFLDNAIYAMRLIVCEAAFTERELGAARRTAFWELLERKKNPETLGWGQPLRILFENP